MIYLIYAIIWGLTAPANCGPASELGWLFSSKELTRLVTVKEIIESFLAEEENSYNSDSEAGAVFLMDEEMPKEPAECEEDMIPRWRAFLIGGC